MRVIESFCAGKREDQSRCEDRVYAGQHFAAVIDGVSDKTGLDYGGMTGGRWAAQTVAEALDALEPDVTLGQAVKRLTGALAVQFTDGPHTGQLAPAGATLACYSRARRELWRVGDGHVAVDGHAQHGAMAIDDVGLAARWAYVQALLELGWSDEQIAADDGQVAVTVPLQRVQHAFANSLTGHPLAYGVLNGRTVPSTLTLCLAVPSGAREVAMSTDGYPVLLPTLAASEAYLTADLAADPLRVGRHRGWAAVAPGGFDDDRAFLRLDVNLAHQ